MAFLTPPSISPTELRLALPASKDLWEARTSTEWRSIFLSKDSKNITLAPSLRSCVEDFGLVLPLRDEVDTQLTSLTILAGLWTPVFSFRQSAQQCSDSGRQNSLIITSLYQQARDAQEAFKVVFTKWSGGLAPTTSVLHEQQLMFLHVSLEDLQLLAGQLGEDEARRTIPILTEWMKRRDSRQALWHAGQLFRTAKKSPGSLPAPSMVAVYHASLVFWAYSALLSINRVAVPTTDLFFNDDSGATICLDGDGDAQHFITLGFGTPVISLHNHTIDEQTVRFVPVRDGRAVMTSIVDFLLNKNGAKDSGECLPLVANLGRLMLALGYAASRM